MESPRVIAIEVELEDDYVVIDSTPGGDGEGVVSGVVRLTGSMPNTVVTLEAEVDTGWDAECSPQTIQYVLPKRSVVENFVVKVWVPSPADPDIEGVLTVTGTASSTGLQSKTDQAVALVIPRPYYDLSVEYGSKRFRCCRNESFKIEGTVTNQGTSDANLVFIIERPFPDSPDYLHYLTVHSDGAEDFSIKVDIPKNATLGDHSFTLYLFAIGFFEFEVVDDQEIQVEVVEPGQDLTPAIVAATCLAATVVVGFLILRRERRRSRASSQGGPAVPTSSRGS